MLKLVLDFALKNEIPFISAYQQRLQKMHALFDILVNFLYFVIVDQLMTILIFHEQVLDFSRMMGQHFDKERRQVGLHGLYTKYQIYVQPLAANYCLQSNLLVTLMLKHDYGTQADTRKLNSFPVLSSVRLFDFSVFSSVFISHQK
jgi:hypothetical protein